jgi:prepilin-type N-terminal cleavage/methylation domain-containing protein
MKFRTKTQFSRMPATKKYSRGFTLVEVLVALLLIAIVVPVTAQGLRLATLAGELSQRKAIAAHIGERVLNEAIVTGQGQSAQSGTEKAGPYEFRWTIHNEAWSPPATSSSLNSPNGINQNVVNANTIQQLSVEVKFVAQGKDHSVRLSTLVNTSQSSSANPPPPMNTLP